MYPGPEGIAKQSVTGMSTSHLQNQYNKHSTETGNLWQSSLRQTEFHE